MNYHEAFVRHARKELPDWQFSQLHHKAHSAAGGAAPRRSALQEDESASEAEILDEEPQEFVQKDGQPSSSDIHVPVPLGSEYSPRRKKKRPRPVPPDTAEVLVAKALNEVAGFDLESIGLRESYEIACAALDAVERLPAVSVGEAVTLHKLAPMQANPLFARICKRAGSTLPIIDASNSKRILYCVGLEPDSYDFQNDTIDAEEIRKTAHKFLTESRIIGSMHARKINAVPVESYIAPQDLTFEGGPYGRQVVRKGSWVLGIKIEDPAEWQKVLQGDYTGISVGGTGQRRNVQESA